ncbi:hypothetical protein LTS08_008919 [Lithohypha guttulata]|uniref:F-box domain-containing protein n=1 Tax=Lithohypha guttulata TaxID=1690604 RepID=A0ABR0JT75_9EURO|nr:hypothetical protein LTR24_010687 [Lithohypha guttulata]KAK5093394.1 hypothetical protein LTS08_008919 [Lithohypha guttulata]KAK5313378.1 hypothetical protein LTR70_007682 [Exophiala xenobiotica]
MVSPKASILGMPAEILTSILGYALSSRTGDSSMHIPVLLACTQFHEIGISILYRSLHICVEDEAGYSRFAKYCRLPTYIYTREDRKLPLTGRWPERDRITFDIDVGENGDRGHYTALLNKISCYGEPCPQTIEIIVQGQINGAVESHVALGIASALKKFSSVQCLTILLRLDMAEKLYCTRPHSGTFQWQLNSWMTALRYLRLHLPNCCLDYYLPLGLCGPFPQLEETIITFETTIDEDGNKHTEEMAEKTYEALVRTKSSGRLPRLSKGLILPIILQRESEPDSLELFRNRLLVYDIVRATSIRLPLLPLSWDESSESSEWLDDASYTPCCRSKYKQQRLNEFMHYRHKAGSDIFVVSFVATLNEILNNITGASVAADFNDPKAPIPRFSLFRMHKKYDREYHDELLQNSNLRTRIPQKMHFVDNQLHGRDDPPAMTVTALEGRI